MTPQKNIIFCGGNLEVVKSWPPNTISAIVTDPPYGLGFMGKEWDTLIEKTRDSAGGFLRNGKSGSNPYAAARCRHGSDSVQMQEWYYHWAKAMLRITKPGGFLLCFGGTRTVHRLTCAIEDAGWEIRDCMMWLYGSGFPKSHNISKAIDKSKGQKGKSLGIVKGRGSNSGEGRYNWNNSDDKVDRCYYEKFESATNLAQLWDGYGTALKPAWEPIIVAMKPLDGTFAHNAEAHGVAGLNIDDGRIKSDGSHIVKGIVTKKTTISGDERTGKALGMYGAGNSFKPTNSPLGRWPANLILDEESAAMLDEQTRETRAAKPSRTGTKFQATGMFPIESEPIRHSGSGASRFFYVAKTSRKERNMGMEDCEGGVKNNHPTVKPLALMKYLCTLLKMPSAGQIILDPFLGSGTTGIACKELGINFIGIEKEREYCEIAVKRIAAVEGQEITLHTDNPSAREPHQTPALDEHRQSIINAAVAALREKRK